MARDLLEELAEELGCNYLSDLRSPAYSGRAVKLALKLLAQYPERQWPEAASYLLDTAADTPDGARALLEQAAQK